MKNLRKNLRKSYEKLMTTKCLTYDKYCDEMAHLYNIVQDILDMKIMKQKKGNTLNHAV